ncbi:hypothetical protein WT25_24460 [Burkholderia territorii]|nr:hypothetical protein WT25_24460 [Burkholderia territorii]
MRSHSSGLTPTKAIQTNRALAVARQGRPAQLNARRIRIRDLITEVSHAADVDLLDSMADDVASFGRHKAAQDARTRAATASITLETGLMQLGRALAPASFGDRRCLRT